VSDTQLGRARADHYRMQGRKQSPSTVGARSHSFLSLKLRKMNSTSLTNPTENSSNLSIIISTQHTPLPSDLTIAEQQLLGSILISVILICVTAYIPVLWVRVFGNFK
jgi:hypothetical protein